MNDYHLAKKCLKLSIGEETLIKTNDKAAFRKYLSDLAIRNQLRLKTKKTEDEEVLKVTREK